MNARAGRACTPTPPAIARRPSPAPERRAGCWASSRIVALAAWLLPTMRATSTGTRCARRWPPTRRPTLAGAVALVAASYPSTAATTCSARRYAHHTAADRHGARRRLRQLCVQPEPRLAGRRRRLSLRLYTQLGCDAAQIGRIDRAEHRDQLVRLAAAGRRRARARQIELPPSCRSAARCRRSASRWRRCRSPTSRRCAARKRREWHGRDHHFRLPAAAHGAAADRRCRPCNWALIGAVVWTLLPAGLSYGTVLATLLERRGGRRDHPRAGRPRRARGGVRRRARLAACRSDHAARGAAGVPRAVLPAAAASPRRRCTWRCEAGARPSREAVSAAGRRSSACSSSRVTPGASSTSFRPLAASRRSPRGR